MAIESVSLETVKFVSRLVAERVTGVDELAQIIALVGNTLSSLTNPKTELRPTPLTPPVAVARPRKARAPRQAAPKPVALSPLEPSAPAEASPVIAATDPVAAPIKRGRGRPRRIVAVAAPVIAEPMEPTIPEPAPQPKLLRRAEWIAHEQELHPVAEPSILARTADRGVVRGVVKWYDGRTGKGVLRLAGISSDIALDSSILERSGLKRLYKDQEIEASTQSNGGRVEVLKLNIPGRAMPSTEAIANGEGETVTRRQPRPIMIEVRRDGGRQKAARAEAEEVFSNLGGKKPSRRITT